MPLSDATSPRRVLVACYSLNGHTRRLAVDLARMCGADLETITDLRLRDGVLGRTRSWLEALLHLKPAIRASRYAPRDYELVIVCTPVWARNMASPVRSWLQRHRGDLRRVACVCTHEGTGHLKVLADMAQLAGKAPVAQLALSAERIELKTYPRRLQDFATRVAAAVPTPWPQRSEAA